MDSLRLSEAKSYIGYFYRARFIRVKVEIFSENLSMKTFSSKDLCIMEFGIPWKNIKFRFLYCVWYVPLGHFPQDFHRCLRGNKLLLNFSVTLNMHLFLDSVEFWFYKGEVEMGEGERKDEGGREEDREGEGERQNWQRYQIASFMRREREIVFPSWEGETPDMVAVLRFESESRGGGWEGGFTLITYGPQGE